MGGGERGSSAAKIHRTAARGHTSVDKAERTAVVDVADPAIRVFASADESTRTAMGDGFHDEEIRGRGSGGYICGQDHGVAGRPRMSRPPLTRPRGRGGCRCGRRRGRERKHGPLPWTRPRDGRGDHRLQGQVCADGRWGCRHRCQREGGTAGADEAARSPLGSLSLWTSPRGMLCEMLPRTRLPGGRGNGGRRRA